MKFSARVVQIMRWSWNNMIIQLCNQLTNNSGFQIYKDSSWNVLASAGFTEESIERVITSSNGLITRHLTIRLDTVLKAVQLPACIANLNTGLPSMDRDTFTLLKKGNIYKYRIVGLLKNRGYHVTSYQAKFTIHHSCNYHAGFFFAWHHTEKHY